MRTKTIFSSLILLLLAVTLNGQIQSTLYTVNQKVIDDFLFLKSINPVDLVYDGSPYLNDQFRTGVVILENGTVYKDILLRYNVYDDLFEFSIKENLYELDKSKKYSEFRIDDQTFIYQSYLRNSAEKEGYIEIVLKGHYSLYKVYKVNLKDAEKEKPYQEATNAKFYSLMPDYLIGKGDGKIVAIRNKKELIKNFDLSEPVRNYSGNKKIKFKNEEDYLHLIKFLNSLSTSHDQPFSIL